MVRVFVSKRGQFRLTIPKHITEAFNLEHGDSINFVLENNLWRLNKGGDIKIHKWNSQVKVNVPKELANRMKLYPNCEIKFRFNDGWFVEIEKLFQM